VQVQPIKPSTGYLGFRGVEPESGRNKGEVFAGIDITIPITGFDIDKMIKFYKTEYPHEYKFSDGLEGGQGKVHIPMKTMMESRAVSALD
jgi:hypothetical protein